MKFDWDEHNIAPILQHRVLPEEVEEALRGRCVQLDISVHSGEERLSKLGRTSAGRILYLVITLRDGRSDLSQHSPRGGPFLVCTPHVTEKSNEARTTAVRERR